MKSGRWFAAILALALAGGALALSASTEQGEAKPAGLVKRLSWRVRGISSAPLQIQVVDVTTLKGIPGVACVIGESGDRMETDERGVTPVVQAPVFRSPNQGEPDGRLTLLCYKNGYSDAVQMGVRMQEGILTRSEVWMYPDEPRD